MKKISILCFCTLFVVGAFAQTATSYGKRYTPLEGDFGLSLDLVSPVMTYAGNLFNKNGNNTFPTSIGSPSMNSNLAITGRYFLTNTKALRVSIGINDVTSVERSYVRDDAAYAINQSSLTLTEDAKTNSDDNMYVTLGLEWRRGGQHLQGYYGLELLAGYTCSTNSYAYGNAITSLNQNPTTFFTPNMVDNVGGNSRLLESNAQSDMGYIAGLGAFVGVEYFLLPKISIGAELSILGSFCQYSQQYEKSERYNQVTEEIEANTRLRSPGDRVFQLSMNHSGSTRNGLFASFYF